MTMNNSMEHSDNYSKTSGSLQQYYRDKGVDKIVFTESLKSKIRITDKNPADGNVKNVTIAVSLKYLTLIWIGGGDNSLLLFFS